MRMKLIAYLVHQVCLFIGQQYNQKAQRVAK